MQRNHVFYMRNPENFLIRFARIATATATSAVTASVTITATTTGTTTATPTATTTATAAATATVIAADIATSVAAAGDATAIATAAAPAIAADIATAIATQFMGYEIDCADACDFNDDGLINLADPVFGLNYLFTFGAVPPPPGAYDDGPDPTEDSLPVCESDDTIC